jgi:H+/gluconate symporter-like permease
MPLLIVALGVVLLLVMMTKLKLNAFIALMLVALFVGLLQGMSLPEVYESMLDGIGGQLDDLVLILGFGAMLGRILADSGAAQRIATSMLAFFGISRVQLAMVLTAFAIGITMFYEVGFILLIPIVFTIVRENRLPLLWVGLPMSIALSTMHSFLPPHPGPAAVAGTFEASMGLTLFYGLFIAMPAAALIAFTWPRLPFVRRMNPSIPVGLVAENDFADEDLPSFGTCLCIVLIPVVLMAGSAIGELTMGEHHPVLTYLAFFGEGPIALLVALLVAIYVLGPNIGRARVLAPAAPLLADDQAHLSPDRRDSEQSHDGGPGSATANAGHGVSGTAQQLKPHSGSGPAGPPAGQAGGSAGGSASGEPAPSRWDAVMNSCSDAVKPMAIIILIIGAGGAFKQVLVDSGMADYVKDLTSGWDISPIILAWAIAVILRIALGSATVAIVTAAGVVLPLVQSSGASPELMVLAVSCGSIACSHVNDPGFWLFKEFFNLSVIQAIKARTTYTSALSVLGLGGVLIMNIIVG